MLHINLVADIEETDFNFIWEMQVQIKMGQFSAVDIIDVSIGKIINILCQFGKNHSQKMLMPEVHKWVKLNFPMPAANTFFTPPIFVKSTL